jgi:hypothetical protein
LPSLEDSGGITVEIRLAGVLMVDLICVLMNLDLKKWWQCVKNGIADQEM